MSEPEHLREVLINLERARARERELRLESEAVLDGLRVVTFSSTRRRCSPSC